MTEFSPIWTKLLQAVDDRIAHAMAAIGVVGTSLPNQLHIAMDNLPATVATAVNADILPDATATRDLGSSSKLWAELYVNKIFATSPKGAVPPLTLDVTYGDPGNIITALRISTTAGAGGTYLMGYNNEAAVSHNTEFVSSAGHVARVVTAERISLSSGPRVSTFWVP